MPSIHELELDLLQILLRGCVAAAVTEALGEAYCEAEQWLLDPGRRITGVNAIKDSGSGFDPSKLPNPTAAENLLASHSSGIFLLKQFMDQVDFKFDNGIEVCMRNRSKNLHMVLGSPNSPPSAGGSDELPAAPPKNKGNVAAALQKGGQHEV